MWGSDMKLSQISSMAALCLLLTGLSENVFAIGAPTGNYLEFTYVSGLTIQATLTSSAPTPSPTTMIAPLGGMQNYYPSYSGYTGGYGPVTTYRRIPPEISINSFGVASSAQAGQVNEIVIMDAPSSMVYDIMQSSCLPPSAAFSWYVNKCSALENKTLTLNGASVNSSDGFILPDGSAIFACRWASAGGVCRASRRILRGALTQTMWQWYHSAPYSTTPITPRTYTQGANSGTWLAPIGGGSIWTFADGLSQITPTQYNSGITTISFHADNKTHTSNNP